MSHEQIQSRCICKACENVNLLFTAAQDGLPNVLECPSCPWFYQWRDDLTQQDVEEVLEREVGRNWMDLGYDRRRIVRSG